MNRNEVPMPEISDEMLAAAVEFWTKADFSEGSHYDGSTSMNVEQTSNELQSEWRSTNADSDN
tara:strand:- start:308 stop:496 length:189 start_codon:yes stop_codon:yes gene_type:complete